MEACLCGFADERVGICGELPKDVEAGFVVEGDLVAQEGVPRL